MYIIEHAFLNIARNKGRNTLLGSIIFAIVAAAIIALTIFNASVAVLADTKNALLCAVRVSPRMRTVGAAAEPAVTMDMYVSFADSQYLDGADIREDPKGVDGVNAVFYLKNPGALADFEAELRVKGLPSDYAARTDESLFERMSGPISSIKDLSLTFLIIVFAVGAIVLSLVSAIAARERKYEIGVLRAMGMKKKQVALGLMAEFLIVACACFTLGIGAGAALSQTVCDAIAAGQAHTEPALSTTLSDRLGADDGDRPEAIDASVGGAAILEIFGASALLATVAGAITIASVTKNEPIKILMERN
jgi:putative ABC transport system permease protein